MLSLFCEKRGKERMFNLGAFVRHQYKDFLGSSPREVHIRSSAADRCLESVALVLASLYKPDDRYSLISNQLIESKIKTNIL